MSRPSRPHLRPAVRRAVATVSLVASSVAVSGMFALPATAAPTVDVFALHSDPASTHTMYLDFDGTTVTGIYQTDPDSTFYVGQTEIVVPPINFDGDGASWSFDEQAFIHEVWREVSQYYALFDVDVTTEQPSADDLKRNSADDDTYGGAVVITDDPDVRSLIVGDDASSAVSGISNVGSFGYLSFGPSWVFPQVSHYDPRSVALTAAHEVGHRLGLVHDRTKDDFPSTSVWGAIMGYRDAPLRQFTGYAPGSQRGLDALGMISRYLPLRADDFGDTTATAQDLGTHPQYSLTGLIGKHTDAPRKDVDVFGVPHQCTADLTASATNSGLGSSLDIRVDILTADGTVLASDDPAPTIAPDDPARVTGLDASATLASAPAGDYYIRVSGVGYGDPDAGGYTDYGSIGTYTLDITGCPQLTTVTESIPTTVTVGTTVTMTAPADADIVTVIDTATATGTVTHTEMATVTSVSTATEAATATTTSVSTTTATVTEQRAGALRGVGTSAASPSGLLNRAAAGNAGIGSEPSAAAGPDSAGSVQELALTGPSSWTPALIGYGLLLLAGGAGVLLIGSRSRRRGGHAG